MGERYSRDVLEEFGLAAEACPLCDGDTILTKDDVIQHLLSEHPPTSMAVYIALIMFITSDDDTEKDG